MTSPFLPPRYILDTNVLIHYCRGSKVGIFIEATYQLKTASQVPLISIVTEGEVRAFAKKNDWGARKLQVMEENLARFVLVPLDYPGIMQAYADIDDFSCRHKVKGAITMGKNDLWIAATARVTGAHLLTTDDDFDHLHPDWLTRYYIDPTSSLPSP